MKTFRLSRAVLVFALALGSLNALHAQITLINIGHANNGGTAQGIVVSNNFAYLAAGTNGLLVYDVSNPTAPLQIGHASSTSGTAAYHLAISSNEAYVTTIAPNPGLNVYDVSNPPSPSNVFRTNYNLFGGVAVDGTNLYLGGDSRLPLFNISNPTNPILVTNPFITPNPTTICIGSNIMVASGGSYLAASTISNGLYSTNFLIANLTNSEAVALAGQYAFVAMNAGTTPLLVCHVLSNALPVVGEITYPSTNASGAGYTVAVSGSYAYVGCTAGVRVINISNPSNLVAVAQTSGAYGGIPYAIAVSGPYAYVANGTDGLRVIEVIPTLSVTQSNGSLLFSWPATSSFALQQKALSDRNWTTLTNVPILVNGTNQLTLSPSGTGAFYRLISM
ncbi:MAG TPA: hypothetical protein VFB72_17575 [Verrucomicrobiae bacterium]|nr:hypothetical protein [Verrucomicrobiae bacterium]